MLLRAQVLLLALIVSMASVHADDNTDPQNDNSNGTVTTDKPSNDDGIDDIAGDGADEFQYVRYTDEYIQLKIHDQAKVACKKGMCTLFVVNENNHFFGVDFTVGYGQQNGAFGNGNLGNGTGVVVVGGGNGGFNDDPEPFVAMTARWGINRCTQKIKVPKALYISMNTYLYNLINEDGTPRRGFTPADEAMIMFYTTIMKQASACSGNNGGRN